MNMPIEPDTLMTSHDVGRLISVNPSSVVKWVNSGKLFAYRTPGKHRRVRAADLVAFLREHQMFVPPELRALGVRRVAFISDDVAAVGALAKAMKAHKARVELTTFTDGIEALLNIGISAPEVVLVDQQLSSIDGAELIKRIKGNPSTEKLEVYAVTTAAKPDVVKKLQGLGARGVLLKPLSATQLLDVVSPAP
jgi:excisionase family DNA binding protein